MRTEARCYGAVITLGIGNVSPPGRRRGGIPHDGGCACSTYRRRGFGDSSPSGKLSTAPRTPSRARPNGWGSYGSECSVASIDTRTDRQQRPVLFTASIETLRTPRYAALLDVCRSLFPGRSVDRHVLGQMPLPAHRACAARGGGSVAALCRPTDLQEVSRWDSSRFCHGTLLLLLQEFRWRRVCSGLSQAAGKSHRGGIAKRGTLATGIERLRCWP